MNQKWFNKGAGLVALLVILFILRPFVIIGAGERGVVLRVGAVQDKIMGEGIHFRVPLFESVIVIDVRTHKIEVEAPSFSKDLQNVETRVALNYHLNPHEVNKLWQEIGSDYTDRIISPAIQEAVKASTANFTAAELISERAKVKDEVKRILLERLQPRYISVDDFSIVNFDFSDAYEAAIEAKQVAQQGALKAENDLRRIEVEAEQRVAGARAEAEAIKIQAEAITQQGGKDYVQLKAIEKWNGVLPGWMTSGSTMPFVNVGVDK